MAALRSRCGHYIFALWPLLSFFLWSPYGIGQTIIFSSCGFFFLSSFLSFFLLFSSPNLSRRRVDVCLPYLNTWCGLSANLRCRSERAARGSLKMQDAKNRCLGTIAQLCRAISSQLRHISTIGKKTC